MARLAGPARSDAEGSAAAAAALIASYQDPPSHPRIGPPRPQETRSIEPQELAAFAAHLAREKKGADVRVYDVSEHIRIASYFVLVTGHSRPHVQAITSEIHARCKELGERHARPEGAELGWWVVLDFVDVVVHVLQPEAREYYQLDALYSECPVLDVSTIPVPAASGRPAARAAE